MSTYRVVTAEGAVLGEPFTAPTDVAAFAARDAHVTAEPIRRQYLIGVEVLLGASWLEAGLWCTAGRRITPRSPQHSQPAR